MVIFAHLHSVLCITIFMKESISIMGLSEGYSPEMSLFVLFFKGTKYILHALPQISTQYITYGYKNGW